MANKYLNNNQKIDQPIKTSNQLIMDPRQNTRSTDRNINGNLAIFEEMFYNQMFTNLDQ